MHAPDALNELATAMKRKLINVNKDLRLERCQKRPCRATLFALRITSQKLDMAYSACLNAGKLTDLSEQAATYRALLASYQQL